MKFKAISSFISVLISIVVLSLSTVPLSAVAIPYEDYVPYELVAKQMEVDELHPYGSALLTFKINNLPTETGSTTLNWYVNIEKKLGDADWASVSFIPTVDFIVSNSNGNNSYFFEQLWIETDDWSGTMPISYRINVVLEDLISNGDGQSAYSNIASIGLKSHGWAVAELKTAQEYGLIPDSLLTADLTQPITREEFCELAVLLYEEVTATTAVAITPNPFTDTTNPQILKAFKLGITNGISLTTFEPKKLITREQCAAMLFRDIQAIRPTNDYSIADVKDFPDQKNIASYAITATKYMSKLGIIKGDSNTGNFMPKAVTTAEKATTYGMATREAAILMAVRTYEKIK